MSLLVAKELKGKIYVAQQAAAVSDTEPGDIGPWYYIGPGMRPHVHLLADGTFLVSFDYLSHLAVRRMDIATWPPTQVDPITYGPTSVQQNEDALILRFASTLGHCDVQTQLVPPNITRGSMYVAIGGDGTRTYSVAFSLDPNWVTNAAGTLYYRLYRKPLVGGSWAPVSGWFTTWPYTDTCVGSMQFQYAATVGQLFDPAHPNDPTRHLESLIGGIVTANHLTDSLDYAVPVGDQIEFAPSILIGNSSFSPDPPQRFYVEAVDDQIETSADEGTQGVGFVGTPVSDGPRAYVVANYAADLSDVVVFKRIEGRSCSAPALLYGA